MSDLRNRWNALPYGYSVRFRINPGRVIHKSWKPAHPPGAMFEDPTFLEAYRLSRDAYLAAIHPGGGVGVLALRGSENAFGVDGGLYRPAYVFGVPSSLPTGLP